MSSKSATSGPAIAKELGLTLPGSATFEFAAYLSGHDDAARLIFTLPVSDWEKLAAQPPFAGAVYQADSVYHMGPDDGAWAPRKASGLMVAQVPYRNGKQSLNIGVSKLDGSTARIYLSWYQL